MSFLIKIVFRDRQLIGWPLQRPCDLWVFGRFFIFELPDSLAMDVMMNMTTEDVRRLRGQFTGSLGLKAFVHLMKRSLRDRIHSELDFVVGVIELFHTIDVNGDAVLDWDEFAAYMMDAGQAKADFYSEARGRSAKHYVPLSMPPPDPKTPLRSIATRVQQMRLLAEQNAVAYFEVNSDVVYIYGLQFDRNDGPRHLSTMRLHTAFQEHTILDVVYVPARRSLVTSSVLVRGYLSVWNVADLYNPVMTHRLESLAAHEHLCWVPFLKSMATSAVVFPSLHSGRASESKRDSYRPNAGTAQPHTKISQLELWDLSGKLRAPAPGTIATKEVAVVQERLKGVTAIVAFKSLNRTYLAVGREDGIMTVVDAENGDEVGCFDAHGSGVKVLVYSAEVESLASVGFHSYADETSTHIGIWKKTSSAGMLLHDATLRQHTAPVELLAFVDSSHQLISVDRTETFNVYSSVIRTPTSEPWECLQTFRYAPPPASTWQLPQTIWSMFVVPETAASDPVLVTAGARVKFYDHCEVKPREEVFFAYYCSALNVVIGATSSRLLLWKGDTGDLWKTYEYAAIVMATKNPTAASAQLGRKQADDTESREAQDRAITAVCVDDRERKVIVGDDTGSIKVLNAVNGNVMKELDPHTHCVVGVSYVLYGKRVLSISSDAVLHICDEDNPQGFYVPFGGGPVQSVLLQSLRLLPEAEVAPVAQESEEDGLGPTQQSSAASPATFVILKSAGNEALNLVAVLVASPRGDSFIQVWNFDMSHSQGTCVVPLGCGDITCMGFFGSTTDIVGGTSTGRVFLWSPLPGTTSYRCLTELSVAAEADERKPGAGITHVTTVCAPEASNADALRHEDAEATAAPSKRLQIFSSRPAIKDRLRLEHERGVHVFASDEGGVVTQWHVRRSCQHIIAFASLQTARPLSRPSSGAGRSKRARAGAAASDAEAFQHEEMAIGFDSIAALYHHARAKSSATDEDAASAPVTGVLEATRQWRAHCGAVLSLEVATEPLAVVTSSGSGQIKLWGVDGEPYGVLDHFATRRAPLNHPWTFPVDMATRWRQCEAEAKELLHNPPGSAWRQALKPRVSVLQQRLSLTNRDLAFSHEHPRVRKGNARPSEAGRAVRNFILAQTTSGVDKKRLTPSAFRSIQQDTSSLRTSPPFPAGPLAH
jgi:WD40 repeat protein